MSPGHDQMVHHLSSLCLQFPHAISHLLCDHNIMLQGLVIVSSLLEEKFLLVIPVVSYLQRVVALMAHCYCCWQAEDFSLSSSVIQLVSSSSWQLIYSYRYLRQLFLAVPLIFVHNSSHSNTTPKDTPTYLTFQIE